MFKTFRSGLLIGLGVAVLVAAAAITYVRFDTKTLKRTAANSFAGSIRIYLASRRSRATNGRALTSISAAPFPRQFSMTLAK